MKLMLRLLATLLFCLGLVLESRSQGYIVPNGVVYVGASNGIPYEVDVIHDPTNLYYTGFILHPSGGTSNTFQFSPYVDVSVRVFMVSSNDAVSLQPIQAGAYTELVAPSTYVLSNGVPFYVGLYTGNVLFAPQNGVYDDPLFGWAELVNNRGVIQMLDGAIEYRGGGILAGTRNILDVPEPNTVGLFAVGALLLGVCRKHALARLSQGHGYLPLSPPVH
jgi:hypothetical protein